MKNRILLISIIIVLIGIFICAQTQQQDEIPNISVEQLKEKIDQNEEIVLLDVRTKKEFTGSLGHLEGAILIPLKELSSRVNELDSLKNSDFVVYCKVGVRSRRATKILLENGFTAFNLLGGMNAWQKMLKDTVDTNDNYIKLKVED